METAYFYHAWFLFQKPAQVVFHVSKTRTKKWHKQCMKTYRRRTPERLSQWPTSPHPKSGDACWLTWSWLVVVNEGQAGREHGATEGTLYEYLVSDL